MEVYSQEIIEAVNAMENAEINERLARDFMGMKACKEWSTISLGAAGGMCLQKQCDCESEGCYPDESVAVGNVHGRVGGIPNYCENWNYTAKLIDETSKRKIEAQILGENGVWSVIMGKNPMTQSSNDCLTLAFSKSCLINFYIHNREAYVSTER